VKVLLITGWAARSHGKDLCNSVMPECVSVCLKMSQHLRYIPIALLFLKLEFMQFNATKFSSLVLI